MELSSLIAISALSWIGILKIVAILVLLGLVAYFAKKYLDESAYAIIIGKIAGFEVKSEYDFPGEKRGHEKLANTVKLADELLSAKEKKILNRKGIASVATSVFTNVVAPMLLRGKK